MDILISPSILSCNFLKLEEQAKELVNSGADYLHIDIMDGNFVDNLTFGPSILYEIKKAIKTTFDVHLMINRPVFFAKKFLDAGADILTVHIETLNNNEIIEIYNLTKSLNKKFCLALKPKTNIETVLPFLHLTDMILIMTVEPGFGGQVFINDCLEKITKLRKELNRLNLKTNIQVDGGINKETAKLCIKAGANVLVSGSYILKSKSYKEAIISLKHNF